MTEQLHGPAPLEPMPTDWTRALAVVAHPDDLEYGCAAAIADWTDGGREVVYLLATRGEAGIDTIAPAECAPLREAEQRASAAVVGVPTVEFLDYHDGVIEYGLDLRRDIAAAIRRHRPELVITMNHRDTWGGAEGGGWWNTPDHKAVGRATLDAAGDAGNRWIFPELLTDQGLEPWNGVRWVAVSGTATPTHAADAGPGMERSVKSLMEHKAYIEVLTDEDPETYVRAFLTGNAQQAAARFGGRPAVAFEVFPR
ncbi:PIG-L family deacetylase [Streptomyces sp. ISL-43]|uniref:PIG-L deacetylase family protein n=1 Tax=Streptomyces sp. ISL-43 TaxID=2819183 RepID=UPI001BED01B4|nr:PIG-L family deacetylase [Streptomyces sp. ISL-43]MBT2448738.1 PIG-L family deacetylase [Streptomyces sp. ISL-43]